MSTRQDRSRKVCWSIVVPDRWHPKISTMRRSLGCARTIERAKRLTDASALRLNSGSSSRSPWRDGSTLGDTWATTSDCPLSDSPPLGHPPLDYTLHDHPAVERGASGPSRAHRGSHPGDPPESGSTE